ncbi:hypothetical protein NL676_021330 [Syzygium grande]|nr:hypothetical protein NL676_021330 [Syzygium grande]
MNITENYKSYLISWVTYKFESSRDIGIADQDGQRRAADDGAEAAQLSAGFTDTAATTASVWREAAHLMVVVERGPAVRGSTGRDAEDSGTLASSARQWHGKDRMIAQCVKESSKKHCLITALPRARAASPSRLRRLLTARHVAVSCLLPLLLPHRSPPIAAIAPAPTSPILPPRATSSSRYIALAPTTPHSLMLTSQLP